MKEIIVVTGSASSGSKLVAKLIAYSSGFTEKIDNWSGHGELRRGEKIILHRSQPWGKTDERKKLFDKFFTLKQFKEKYKDSKIIFIICTRYIQISKKKYNFEEEKCLEILDQIIKNEDFFIWNYETFLFLKDSYFEILCKYLKIENKNINLNKLIKDGNIKYIK